MKIAKIISLSFHAFLTFILALLGILVFLCNVIGLWKIWQLAGFAFIFFVPITILLFITALVLSCISKDIKFIIINTCLGLFTILFSVFTIIVSATWFW